MKFNEIDLNGQSEVKFLINRFTGLKYAREKTIRTLYKWENVIQVVSHTAVSYLDKPDLDKPELKKFIFAYNDSKYDVRINVNSPHVAELEKLITKLNHYEATMATIKFILNKKYATGVQ